MEKTKLYQKADYYSPLFITVGEKEYELDNIIFFNDNEEILKIGRGFFDDRKEKEFNGETVKKIKIDYSSKKNFIVKAKPEYYNSEVKYNLYIREENANIEYLGEQQICFGDIYKVYKINDSIEKQYVKTLKGKLDNLNDKAETLLKSISSEYGYGKYGIEENVLDEKIKELKTLNKQIIKEVDRIKNYKI